MDCVADCDGVPPDFVAVSSLEKESVLERVPEWFPTIDFERVDDKVSEALSCCVRLLDMVSSSLKEPDLV